MKDLMLYDAVELTKPRITKDGYLVGEAHVARTGIQEYFAAELGLDGVDPMKTIRVYRPADEVFSKDSMASYAHRPLTVDHPPEMVVADNWKQYSRGSTGDEVMRDGERVRVPVMLMDQAAIQDWRDGKREFSMGYTMRLELKDGITPEGEKYDAVQHDLRMNHLALVARARGGSELRLGDGHLEESTMERKLTTVTVDGLAVETTDAGAQAIAKLQKDNDTLRQQKDQQASEHAEALKAKDQELAKKDAAIDDLKGQVLDETALDARVKERGDLIAQAKQVADKDYSGMSADAIRKAAVEAKLGSSVVDGKSPAYIEARFDTLVEDAEQDPVRQVVRGGAFPASNASDKAYDGHVSHLESAWKQKEAS